MPSQEPARVHVARAREEAVSALATIETVGFLMHDRSLPAEEAAKLRPMLADAADKLRRALDRLSYLADPSGPWPKPEGA